ncbi:MAG: hypothetical protein HRF49_07550 [bacterium]|jgi:hypothetical protein
MANSVLISANWQESTLAIRLGEQFPGQVSDALHIWFQLLSPYNRDDWGRGRYMPSVFRSRAFSNDPKKLMEVSVADVERWIKKMADEGSVVLYGTDEMGRSPAYYYLPKFKLYNPLKYRKASKLPPPPGWSDESEEIVASVEADPLDVERAVQILGVIHRNYEFWGWNAERLPKRPTAKDIKTLRLLRERDKITNADFYNFLATLSTDRDDSRGFCWAKQVRSVSCLRSVCRNGESKFWNMVNFAKEAYTDAR